MRFRYKDFQEYLMDVFAKEEPQVLDDDMSDAFDAWLQDLDCDTWIKYGNEYAKIFKEQI